MISLLNMLKILWISVKDGCQKTTEINVSAQWTETQQIVVPLKDQNIYFIFTVKVSNNLTLKQRA
jgi:hypothetical protein